MSLAGWELNDLVGTVTLDNPDKANCLSTELIDGLIQAFDHLESATARAVMLRSKGRGVWSAGHDIDELPTDNEDPLSWGIPLERLLRRIRSFPAPVIAVVDGSVWGGACDLCLTCDIVLCTPAATFAMTPAKLGIPYNATGLTHFIGVVGLHKAKEMFFTAQPIGAAEALAAGLVNHVVDDDALERRAREMADTIAANAPLAVAAIKEQLNLLSQGSPLPPATYERLQSLRRGVYESDDYHHAIESFKNKQTPTFEGR